MMIRHALGTVCVPLAFLTACATEVGQPEVDDRASTAAEPLTKGVFDPGPIEWQPSRRCVLAHPYCSATPLGFEWDDDGWVALGCAKPFDYKTGYSEGLLGGVVSLCPDTPAAHARYGSGLSPQCDRCLGYPTPGFFYVYFIMELGPRCQTGCNRNDVAADPSDQPTN